MECTVLTVFLRGYYTGPSFCVCVVLAFKKTDTPGECRFVILGEDEECTHIYMGIFTW